MRWSPSDCCCQLTPLRISARRRTARRSDSDSIARQFARPDLAPEQWPARQIAKRRVPLAAALALASKHGVAEAVIGAAVAHRGAANRPAGKVALDPAAQQRASGAEHELRAALVGKAQHLRDMDVAGERKRDAVGQLAVPRRERLLQ